MSQKDYPNILVELEQFIDYQLHSCDLMELIEDMDLSQTEAAK